MIRDNSIKFWIEFKTFVLAKLLCSSIHMQHATHAVLYKTHKLEAKARAIACQTRGFKQWQPYILNQLIFF